MKMEEDVDVEAEVSAGGSPSGEALLESDVILPAQYFDMCRQTTHVDTGIHRLMLTLLGDGIRCWPEGTHAFPRRQRRLAFHDDQWIFSDTQEGPVPPENTCAAPEIAGDVPRGAVPRS